MNHTDNKILSLSTALLLCMATLTLAAPPDGKGKPPKGNQPVAATALFSEGISSNMALQGELIDNGGFDTLHGQLAGGETITVMGDAGEALEILGLSFLPEYGVDLLGSGMVMFAESSGVSWTIRLDRDKVPPNRVQFKMRWVNKDGLERHLRIGWVVQFLSGEELTFDDTTDDYGKVTNESTSLEEAVIEFVSDPFRIDGDVKVDGRGKKKTELVVFSRYGELYSSDAPWCGVNGESADICKASTTIQTDLVTN